MSDNPYEPPQNVSTPTPTRDVPSPTPNYYYSTFLFWVYLGVLVFCVALIYSAYELMPKFGILGFIFVVWIALTYGLWTILLGLVLTYPIAVLRKYWAERRPSKFD